MAKGTGSITITELNESYSALLSNEAVTISTDSSGNNPNMSGASTTALLMLGNQAVTAYLGTPTTSGCSASVSGTTVTMTTPLTSDTGYVDIPVYSDSAKTNLIATKRFSFAKSKTGAQGNPGSVGAAYILNIVGGNRSITYAADGSTPNPSTGGNFTYTLYKSGVSATPTSVSWSATGALSGTSTHLTNAYQPTIASQFNSGTMANTTVTISVVIDGNTVTQTVPIAVQRDAQGLSWVNDWNSNTVVIGGTSIVTPKIFAGTNNNGALTGIAIGRDVLAGSTKQGIYGYGTVDGVINTAIFSINPDTTMNGGNMAVFGVEAGRQLIIKNDGKLIVPDFSADSIKGGILQLGGVEYAAAGHGGEGHIYNEWGDLVTTFGAEGTRIRFYEHYDEETLLPEFETPFMVTVEDDETKPLLTFDDVGNMRFAGGMLAQNIDITQTNNNQVLMTRTGISFQKQNFNYFMMQTPSVDHYADVSVVEETPALRITSSTGKKTMTRNVGHLMTKGVINGKEEVSLNVRLAPHFVVNAILVVALPLVDANNQPVLDATGNLQPDPNYTFVQGQDYKLTVTPASGSSYAKYYVDWSQAATTWGAAAALHQPPTGLRYLVSYNITAASSTGTNTVLGYMDIGVKDWGAANIETDRPKFFMNKPIQLYCDDTLASNEVHAELFRVEGTVEKPIALRFHQATRFWHRIEATSAGFHLKTGDATSNNHSNLTAATITAEGGLVVNGSTTIAGTTLANAWLKVGSNLGIDDNEIYFGTQGYIGTIGANDLTFRLNGGDRVTFKSDGKVGIGTAAPAYQLQVNGSIGYDDISRYWLATATNWGIYWDTTDNRIEFHGAGTDRFGVDLDNGDIVSAGTLKLGTNFVAGTSVAGGFYQDALNGAYRSIVTSGESGFHFQPNGGGASHMFIGLVGTYAGRVGIGNATPGEKLDITSGNIKINGGVLRMADTTAQTTTELRSFNNADSFWIIQATKSEVHFGTDINYDLSIGVKYTPGTIGVASGVLQIGQTRKNNANYTHGITSLFTNGIERIRIDSAGDVGIGTTDPTEKLEVVGKVKHNGLVPTAGTEIDQIYTVTDSLTLTTSWQDTSVNAAELATGTYIVQVYIAGDYGVGGGQYWEYYSGIMSWYASNTNSTVADEIVLHRAGHAPTTGTIFLRIQRAVDADANDMRLQISGTTANTGASNYQFKFRRMI